MCLHKSSPGCHGEPLAGGDNARGRYVWVRARLEPFSKVVMNERLLWFSALPGNFPNELHRRLIPQTSSVEWREGESLDCDSVKTAQALNRRRNRCDWEVGCYSSTNRDRLLEFAFGARAQHFPLTVGSPTVSVLSNGGANGLVGSLDPALRSTILPRTGALRPN